MKVAICGGGVIGMATAMLLARDGHAVTVLERDVGPVPQSAAEADTRFNGFLSRRQEALTRSANHRRP